MSESQKSPNGLSDEVPSEEIGRSNKFPCGSPEIEAEPGETSLKPPQEPIVPETNAEITDTSEGGNGGIEEPAATEKQLSANRANAMRSTGPKTASGKAIARLNSWKHGLTANSIVIRGERASDFEKLRSTLREGAESSFGARERTG